MIQHVGIIIRLDAWQVVASKKHLNKDIKSLEDYAKLNLTWEDIIVLLHLLCQDYVAGKTDDLAWAHNQPKAQWDQQGENTLLLHRYFLLYK